MDLLVHGQVIQEKKALTDLTVPLARDNLHGLVRNLASKVINKFERKISGKGPVSAETKFTLFIQNEDINDVNKIVKPLQDCGILW